MLIRVILIAVCLSVSSVALSDSWSFKPEKKVDEYVFGDVKIVRTSDTTDNIQYPDYSIEVYSNNELKSLYRGLSFEFIYSDKNNSTFVALSNSGLHNAALIVFGKNGTLGQVLFHDKFAPDYCEESSTLRREWVDKKDPKVEFTYKKLGDDYEYISDMSLITCKGDRRVIDELFIEGLERKVQKTKAFKAEYEEYQRRKAEAESK